MQTIRQLGMSPGVPRALLRRDLCSSRPRQGANFVDHFRPVMAFGVFLNLPFLIAPRLLHLSARGMVNVEYLAVGIMACFLRRAPAVAVLALVTACDMVERSTFVFYFSQRDLTSSLKYLSLVPLTQRPKGME